jgi:hypothetical protein
MAILNGINASVSVSGTLLEDFDYASLEKIIIDRMAERMAEDIEREIMFGTHGQSSQGEMFKWDVISILKRAILPTVREIRDE